MIPNKKSFLKKAKKSTAFHVPVGSLRCRRHKTKTRKRGAYFFSLSDSEPCFVSSKILVSFLSFFFVFTSKQSGRKVTRFSTTCVCLIRLRSLRKSSVLCILSFSLPLFSSFLSIFFQSRNHGTHSSAVVSVRVCYCPVLYVRKANKKPQDFFKI